MKNQRRYPIPSISKQLKEARINSRPNKDPVNARGIVITLMSGRRKELNCQISRTMMPKMHSGIHPIILWM